MSVNVLAGADPATLRHDVLAVVEDVLDCCSVAWDGSARQSRHAGDHGHELLAELRRWFAVEGKMLRARFCYHGHAAAGGSHGDVVRLGAALELLHTFAIVQDDVMDASATRRGVPTTHRRFAPLHAAAGWRGERRRFAEGMAVLVGDRAHALANRLVSDLPATVRLLWGDLCEELVLGQYLDVRGTASGGADVGSAETVALLKSARYTVARPLQLGAALAGAPDRLIETLGWAGESLGLAFQLRDDLLGVFGDPNLTGKPVGDDLRDGKPTLLLALTTARAPAGAGPLLAKIGSPTLTNGDVAAIARLCITTGALEEVNARIERGVAGARRGLDTALQARGGADALTELIDDVAGRHR
jgi:geranylgeranyl diphosphate synthase type I